MRNKYGEKAVYFGVKEGDKCPHCSFGMIRKKQGKFGEFYSCDSFPNCAFSEKIKLTYGK